MKNVMHVKLEINLQSVIPSLHGQRRHLLENN